MAPFIRVCECESVQRCGQAGQEVLWRSHRCARHPQALCVEVIEANDDVSLKPTKQPLIIAASFFLKYLIHIQWYQLSTDDAMTVCIHIKLRAQGGALRFDANVPLRSGLCDMNDTICRLISLRKAPSQLLKKKKKHVTRHSRARRWPEHVSEGFILEANELEADQAHQDAQLNIPLSRSRPKQILR